MVALARAKHQRALLVISGTLCLAVTGSSLGAEAPYEGAYAGKRVWMEGSRQSCPAEDDVTVTIKGSILRFTNSALQDFDITLEPGSDGSFAQTSVRGGTTVSIRGRITGGTIDADIVNFANQCKHHWHLTKQQPGR
jgi:hypothetical protein